MTTKKFERIAGNYVAMLLKEGFTDVTWHSFFVGEDFKEPKFNFFKNFNSFTHKSEGKNSFVGYGGHTFEIIKTKGLDKDEVVILPSKINKQ